MMFRVVKMIRASKVDGLKASLGKKKKKKKAWLVAIKRPKIKPLGVKVHNFQLLVMKS